MMHLLKKIRGVWYGPETRFYSLLVVSAFFVSIGIVYWQHKLTIKEIITNIESSIFISKNDLNNSFNAYNAMLKIISSKLKLREKEINTQYISTLLKKFYITTKNQNSSKINFTDINWQGVRKNSINRYGNIPAIKFPQYVENLIRSFPKQTYLFSIPAENKISHANDTFLTMGITNSENTYIGKLTLHLDFDSWVNDLTSKISSYGLIAILVDQNHRILLFDDNAFDFFIPSNLIERLEKNSTNLTQAIDSENFLITHYLLIEPYNFKLLYGYDKRFLNKQTFKKARPLLLVFWVAVLISILSQFLYNRWLKEIIKQDFITSINELTKANITHIRAKEKLKKRLLKQIGILQKEAKIHSDKINAGKISEIEKRKLQSLINNRILLSLIELKEIARVLIGSSEGDIKIAINYNQQIKLLSSTHTKLEYLSLGCVVKEKKEIINLEAVINDTIKLFHKEILDNNLSIKINIIKTIKDFIFDEVLLRQLLANLLREAITGTKPAGKIKIHITNKRIDDIDNIFFIIKDNGFGIHDQFLINDNEDCHYRSTSPLELALNIIKELIEACNGTLEIICVISQGKTIIFSLPYGDISSRSFIGGNVVLFKNN